MLLVTQPLLEVSILQVYIFFLCRSHILKLFEWKVDLVGLGMSHLELIFKPGDWEGIKRR